MLTTERAERNNKARQNVIKVNEKGWRWNAISSYIGIQYRSFSNWKRGDYDLSISRLEDLESLIDKFDKF